MNFVVIAFGNCSLLITLSLLIIQGHKQYQIVKKPALSHLDFFVCVFGLFESNLLQS